VIATRDYQFDVRKPFGDQFEGLKHRLQSFVSPQLSKSQKPVYRIAPKREVGIFGQVRQNAMSPHMNVLPSVLLQKNFAVGGHQNSHRVGHQQHSGGKSTGCPIQARETHASVFQIDCIHQMVQGHMGITATQTRK